jgi:hypothetical protein
MQMNDNISLNKDFRNHSSSNNLFSGPTPETNIQPYRQPVNAKQGYMIFCAIPHVPPPYFLQLLLGGNFQAPSIITVHNNWQKDPVQRLITIRSYSDLLKIIEPYTHCKMSEIFHGNLIQIGTANPKFPMSIIILDLDNVYLLHLPHQLHEFRKLAERHGLEMMMSIQEYISFNNHIQTVGSAPSFSIESETTFQVQEQIIAQSQAPVEAQPAPHQSPRTRWADTVDSSSDEEAYEYQ